MVNWTPPARWLSLTPEPERELPRLVATLRERPAAPAAVEHERDRIERLILRGREGRWLAYLHAVVELIDRTEGSADPELACARARALEVISNHHNLLLAISPRGAERTAGERERLWALLAGRPNPDQEYEYEHHG